MSNVQPSPAEVDFVRKALALGRRLLTLRQTARCVAQRLVRDPDGNLIQSLLQVLGRRVPELPITVTLAMGMIRRSFGSSGIRSGKDGHSGEMFIAINYQVGGLRRHH